MEDDLFQSLGGSLMKDLLADLQGDDGEGDGWLSLEQLEKELSQLDDNSAPTPPAPGLGSLPLPPVQPSAASMVVTGQQQFQQHQQQQQPQQPIQGVGLLGAVTVTKAPADAWKESLQKFTALSLDQDFLAADTVRKQKKGQQATTAATTPQLPPGFMAEAEDYDATEKVTLKPPPGLGQSGSGPPPPPPPGMKPPPVPMDEPPPGIKPVVVVDEDKEREEKALLAVATLLPQGVPGGVPSIPQRKQLPTTPANSMVVFPSAADDGQKARVASRMPKTPRNSVIISSAEEADEAAAKADDDYDDDIPMMGKVTILQKEHDMNQGESVRLPPKTPRNSVTIPSQEAAAAVAEAALAPEVQAAPKLPTKTLRNSVVVPSQDAAAAAVVAASAAAQGMAMPPQTQTQGMRPPQGMPPGIRPTPQGMPGIPPHGMLPPPPQGMLPPQGILPPQGMPPPPQGMPPPPQGMPPGMHPHGMPPPSMMVPPGGAVPVAMPTGGPAWQTGPRPPPPPPPMRVFCNPHPNAPPIPAQVLESKMMKSRDITYIVHSILKPVLMAGFSEHDYDIQLLHRQSGGRPAGPRPLMMRRGKQGHNADGSEDAASPVEVIRQEMESREKKSKEWSTKNAALGHVAKANVARPRALIASPALSQSNQDKPENASEQKQRARLWKARIYCDQAYQAYLAVVDIWAKAAPGSVPPGVHAPLIRLMKCLGIAPVASSSSEESATTPPVATTSGGGDFQVDPAILQLFLKLSKGRILFARIIEQALLPPSAVQAVLPATLDTLYKTPLPSNDNKHGGGAATSAYGGDVTDDRCFRALTVVVQTLPTLSGESILKCAEMMKAQSEAALSSTSRMECLHALLQRGTGLAASNDPALGDYPVKWKEEEDSFMAILSGM